MKPFITLEAIAAPLDQSNIDTGQILPARFLRRPRSGGYQDFLFRDLRFNEDGSEKPGFVLNQAPYRKAGIVVADVNFGIGSSREQAGWSLADYGIRCVIAAGFGDIFYSNSFNCGLLPVQLEVMACARLRAQLHERPGAVLRIDLPQQTVTGPDAAQYRFDIDPSHKRGLLEGLDDIGLTLRHEAAIGRFEASYRQRFDWLFDMPQKT